MNEKDALRYALEMMDTADAAYLTTLDAQGFPQTRAMLNLRNNVRYPKLQEMFEAHKEDFLVYFTTNTSSQKVEQIAQNPRASVYYAKPSEWRGLMLGGLISVVTDMKLKKSLWQPAWDMYYHQGPTDPDYAILVMKPAVAKLYHQMHFVEIRFTGQE